MSSKSDIKLIKAKIEDKDFLFDLRKQTMVEHLEKSGLFLSDEEHRKRVDKSFENSFLILYQEHRAGLLKYEENEALLEVLQVQILPKYQNKGIGKQVLQYLFEKEKIIQLKVLKDNPAKNLYARLGFITVGEDEHEYHMERACRK
ncbi:GNAT family N-acetyltransferase [Aquimarina spongiae]|uniref:Acetyltransferase (GNAT) domain-containing protein n=1 Tax=Aquimarina spongiae TaxID=570521 RepID=A0A1M6FE47_9FLAO|nr:GNAT family N-acetyltransferase [Aquimarina spongiae]SHI95916.1 Acetyltransferase (GNAT) domain-containing protein [Aquimarina spongiae]